MQCSRKFEKIKKDAILHPFNINSTTNLIAKMQYGSGSFEFTQNGKPKKLFIS